MVKITISFQCWIMTCSKRAIAQHFFYGNFHVFGIALFKFIRWSLTFYSHFRIIHKGSNSNTPKSDYKNNNTLEGSFELGKFIQIVEWNTLIMCECCEGNKLLWSEFLVLRWKPMYFKAVVHLFEIYCTCTI